MKKILLYLTLIITISGCNKNPVAGTTWIGENQYYYDVISFSEDSLTYCGIDMNGEIVVPEVKLPYMLNTDGKRYGIPYRSHLDTAIIHRPLIFDSISTYNIISGFQITKEGELKIHRSWSADGKKWDLEYPDYEPIEFYKTDKTKALSPREVIRNREYHGILSIMRDRFYLKEGTIGAKNKDDFYLYHKYLSEGFGDSINDLLSTGRIEKFNDKWLVKGKSANADYVYVEKERGGDKYYVDWNALVNYSNSSTTYHSIETGNPQSSYGGSREQLRDLEMADESLTEYEKSIEAEYERQVERELREINE